MGLNSEEIALLKKQGLEADIRNKLGCVKMIPIIFKQYQIEDNPVRKEEFFQLLSKEIEKIEKSVNHICDSFIFFEIIEKK